MRKSYLICSKCRKTRFVQLPKHAWYIYFSRTGRTISKDIANKHFRCC